MPTNTREAARAEAEATGVDLPLLRERLRPTPTERIERNGKLLALDEALRAAGSVVPPNLPPPPSQGGGRGADSAVSPTARDGRLLPVAFRRALRSGATTAERRLWTALRGSGVGNVRWRRQHPVGPFVVDFYCAAARLVVELDGDVHGNPARHAYDGRRQEALERAGLLVLRFTNDDVARVPGLVVEAIGRAMGARVKSQNPPPGPLLAKEGEAEQGETYLATNTRRSTRA